MVRALITCMFLFGCSTPTRVLVISKTEGFRHESISVAIDAITTIANELKFELIATEDTSLLCSEQYDLAIFLHTTGNTMNEREQKALRLFVESGGGFLGIHAAADAEYDWSWYGEVLVGAWFVSHPPVCEASVQVTQEPHVSTEHLQEFWNCTDEWYVFDRVPVDATVLLKVNNHPLAWCRNIGNGRSFYIGRGHTKESWTETLFIEHVRGAMQWLVNRK